MSSSPSISRANSLGSPIKRTNRRASLTPKAMSRKKSFGGESGTASKVNASTSKRRQSLSNIRARSPSPKPAPRRLSFGSPGFSQQAIPHNPDAIQVVVRVRPSGTDVSRGFVTLADENAILVNHAGDKAHGKKLLFDKVYPETTSQETVFNSHAINIVQGVMEGYNGTIFAYGQTSSGKTHTMTGDLSIASQRGLIPRAVEHIFSSIDNTMSSNTELEHTVYSVSVQYCELYNEKIYDLLQTNNIAHEQSMSWGKKESNGKTTRQHLPVRENRDGFYVQGLTSTEINSVDDVLQLIEAGSQNRTVSATQKNAVSSRSHSLFTLEISSVTTNSNGITTKTAKLNLVDLAGSEKYDATKESKNQSETTNINGSLQKLGQVMDALSKQSSDASGVHVSYRNSKLTMLLRDALGGNSRTLMISCMSSALCNFSESLSTLGYASRCKKITNHAKANSKEQKQAEIKKLNSQNTALQAELAKYQALTSQFSNWLQTTQETLSEVIASKKQQQAAAAASTPSSSRKQKKNTPQRSGKKSTGPLSPLKLNVSLSNATLQQQQRVIEGDETSSSLTSLGDEENALITAMSNMLNDCSPVKSLKSKTDSASDTVCDDVVPSSSLEKMTKTEEVVPQTTSSSVVDTLVSTFQAQMQSMNNDLLTICTVAHSAMKLELDNTHLEENLFISKQQNEQIKSELQGLKKDRVAAMKVQKELSQNLLHSVEVAKQEALLSEQTVMNLRVQIDELKQDAHKNELEYSKLRFHQAYTHMEHAMKVLLAKKELKTELKASSFNNKRDKIAAAFQIRQAKQDLQGQLLEVQEQLEHKIQEEALLKENTAKQVATQAAALVLQEERSARIVESLRESLTHKTSMLESKKAVVNKLNENLCDVKEEMSVLKQAQADLIQQYSENEQSFREQTLNLQNEVTSSQAALSDVQKTLVSREEELNKVHEEMQSLQNKLKVAQSQVHSSDDVANELKMTISELNAQITQLQLDVVPSLENEIAKLRRNGAELSEKIALHLKTEEDLQTRANEQEIQFRSELNRVIASKNSTSAMYIKTQKALQQRDGEYTQLQRDLDRARKKYEHVTCTVDQLQIAFTSLREEALKEQEALALRLNDVTMQFKQEQARANAEADAHEKSLAIRQDEYTRLEQKYKQEVLELQNAHRNTQERMRVKKDEYDGIIETLQRDNEAMKARLCVRDIAVTESQTKLGALEDKHAMKMTKLTAMLEQVTIKLETQTKKIGSLQGQLKRANASKSKALEAHKELLISHKLAEAQGYESSRVVTALQKESCELKSSETQLQGQVMRLTSQIGELCQEKERVLLLKEEIAAELAISSHKLAALDEEKAVLMAEKEATEQTVSMLLDKANVLHAQKQELSAEVLKLKECCREQVHNLTTELSDVKNELKMKTDVKYVEARHVDAMNAIREEMAQIKQSKVDLARESSIHVQSLREEVELWQHIGCEGANQRTRLKNVLKLLLNEHVQDEKVQQALRWVYDDSSSGHHHDDRAIINNAAVTPSKNNVN